MKKVRVAINGFGRIGRAFFRGAWDHSDIEIVAINDLGDIENLVYLLKYDSAYGRSGLDVSVSDSGIKIGEKEVLFSQEKEPNLLPWGENDIDVVVESTGFFTEYAKAKAHIDAGAKRVVISAPAKGGDIEEIKTATILMGINNHELKASRITSNASCTTNASSPVIQILHNTIGIEKALLNTIHAYTATQPLVDVPNKKDFRKGRAAAQNIIPTTTGAAQAVTKVITELDGNFDGIAMRVPVITGSIADITFVTQRETSVEEVNTILTEAAKEERWNKIFSVTDEPIVSSDIISSKYAATVDVKFTKVIGGDLVKVLSWYDNEVGYTHSLIEHVVEAGQYV